MNYTRILSSPEAKAYVKSCHEMKEYYNTCLPHPSEMEKRYKAALEDYRIYLSNVIGKMSEPIYPYHTKEYSSWKYIDVFITNNCKVKWVPNPNWRYQGEFNERGSKLRRDAPWKKK